MELDLLIDNLNLEYYKSLQYCFNENGNHLLWLNEHIEKLTNKNTKNSEIKKEQKQTSETENHKQIFSDEGFYNKNWIKLNPIHKILKIKEFVNGLKNINKKDKNDLIDKLVNSIKTKILTKKENVNYDEINGKIISLTNLEYKNDKYHYNE
jgi:hypothetical protein